MRAVLRHLLSIPLYLLRIAVHLGIVGVACATVAPMLFPRIPILVTLDSFKPQFAVAALVLTLPALLFRPRVLALLGPAALAWNLWVLWPYLPVGLIPRFAPAPQVAALQATTAGPTLKVISANVWYRNGDYQAVVNYLTATDADVVGLIEVTPNLMRTLEPLYAKYPYRVECVSLPQSCEMMLLSKLPFRRSYAGRIDGRPPAIVWGEVALEGRPLVIALTHFAWPLLPAQDDETAQASGTLLASPEIGDTPLLQVQQARNLAQYLTRPDVPGLGRDIVLMGDFNSVPWSGTHAALRRDTGLDNRGPAVPTWPSWQPQWLRLPIDHVFVGGDLVRSVFRHGPYINSDHLPVEAEIGFRNPQN